MKILLHYRHFPMAIGRYFDFALRDLGHDVKTIGCYNGPNIPWGEQYNFPKYDSPPDIQIPEMEDFPLDYVLSKLGDWEPDIVIQASDVTYLSGQPKLPIPNVIIATDPHAVDYSTRLRNATHFFCMQNNYLSRYDFPNKYWLPYAYEPSIHYNMHLEPEYDVVFIGLQYPQRLQVLDTLRQRGWNVFHSLGYIFDEYREIYNKGKIAFNWSSIDDLPARFWEGMAMGRCMVTNHVPDLDILMTDFSLPASSCSIFTDFHAAIYCIEEMLTQGLWKNTASEGEEWVKPHTWQSRCKEMLEIVCQK